jgi:hypothetical protein
MLKVFNKFYFVVVSLFISLQVSAQSIPMADQMASDIDSDTNVFDWIKQLIGEGAGLVFFGIGGIVFVVVMYGIIMKFIEWRKEKVELGELINFTGMSIGILVVVFVLLGFAKTAMVA